MTTAAVRQTKQDETRHFETGTINPKLRSQPTPAATTQSKQATRGREVDCSTQLGGAGQGMEGKRDGTRLRLSDSDDGSNVTGELTRPIADP